MCSFTQMAIRSSIGPNTDEMLRRRIARAIVDSDRDLRALRRAAQAGDRQLTNRLFRTYVRSFNARLAAADRTRKALLARVQRFAARTPLDARRPYSVPTLREMFELARRVDLYATSDELATMVDVAKPNGGRRSLTVLRRDRLIRSYVMDQALRAITLLHPGQLAMRDEGLAGAHRRIIEIISDPAITHVAMADIRGFYDNIDASRLGEFFGIPQTLIDNNASYRNMRLIHHDRTQSSVGCEDIPSEDERPGAVTGLGQMEVERRAPAYDQEGEEVERPVSRSSVYSQVCSSNRRGTPQGAPSSTIIGEGVVAQAFYSLHGNIIPNSWIDNFYLLGSNRADVEAGAETLRSNLLESPTGPYELHDQVTRRVADGFEALGGHFKRRKGRVTFRPTDKNLRMHKADVGRFLALIAQTGAGVREAKAYVRSWSAAFSAWEGAMVHKQTTLRDIDLIDRNARLYRRYRPDRRFARFLGLTDLLSMRVDRSIFWNEPRIQGFSPSGRFSTPSTPRTSRISVAVPMSVDSRAIQMG